jgi:hypothetical protein
MTDQKPLTEQQLDDIETRADAATPGPWELYDGYGPHFYAYLRGSHLQGIGTLNFGDGEAADADRAFVLQAREDVPALLAEVRRLRVERDAFRDQRNRVFETNQRLIAEVHESDQARLRAENETRTALRSTAVEGAQR